MMHYNRKRAHPKLTALEKVNAIQRIRLGESKASVARSIDCPESTLRGWCKMEDKLRSLAFQAYADERYMEEKKISQNKSAVDPAASYTNGEPPNKMKKSNFTSNDMTVKQRSSDAIDLSNYNQSLVPFQYNGLSHTGDKTTSSANGQIKYEDNKRRSYVADVKTNEKNKSAISMTAASPMTSHNGMSSNGQSTNGLSYQEIASNLNMMAWLNHQSYLTRDLTKDNGLRSAMSQGVSSQLNGSTMDKSDMRGVTDNMKISSAVPYDKSQYWRASHQPISVSNNQPMSASHYVYPSMPARPSVQQQHHHHLQNMVPPTTSILPILSSTPQKTTTTQPIDDANSARFMIWYKYNQLLADMMSDKSKGMNHNVKPKYLTKEMNSMSPTTSNNHFFNYTGSPEELSKFNPRFNPVTQSIKTEMEYTVSSSTLSPIPLLVETGNKKEVIVLNEGSDNTSNNTSNNSSNNTSNSTNKADGIIDSALIGAVEANKADVSGSDSTLIDAVEAVKYGEKFLKWFEAYSDPTITTQDLLQFQRLLKKIKNIAERENRPTVGSTKSRRK